MRNEAHFEAVLHPPDLIKSMTTTARVEFDGRPAYKMRVVFVSGQQRDEFYDVERGLLLGIEGESQTPMGVVPVKVMLRDYKPFGALTHPARLVQSTMGIEQHFVFETYEYNTVKPEAFDPPAIIRTLTKTGEGQKGPYPAGTVQRGCATQLELRDTHWSCTLHESDGAVVNFSLHFTNSGAVIQGRGAPEGYEVWAPASLSDAQRFAPNRYWAVNTTGTEARLFIDIIPSLLVLRPPDAQCRLNGVMSVVNDDDHERFSRLQPLPPPAGSQELFRLRGEPGGGKTVCERQR